MMWYDMIWYDVLWYNIMWYDVIWIDVIWYDMIWYDMIWYEMIWYDMIWYDMIWYTMIWYDDMIRCIRIQHDVLFQFSIMVQNEVLWFDIIYYDNIQSVVSNYILHLPIALQAHTLSVDITSIVIFLQPACLAQSPQLYKQMACACGGLDR